MSSQPTKILISGATGFIGTNLIAYLNEKMDNVSFVYLVRNKRGEGGEVLWKELSEQHLNNIDTVIHLAGLAHDTKNTLDENAYYEVNYELTKKLYNLYMKSSATKFIYTSSVKAIADTVDGVLNEDVSPKPATPYGMSKLKAERYIQQLSLGVNDKQHYILRPCMVHGPGNKGNLNLLYKFVKKGLPYPLGAYQNTRSFLSIDNFCFVCHQLVTKKIDSGVYNLADDKALSTQELYNLIATTIQKKAGVLKLPKFFISSIAKFGDRLNLPINTERLTKLTENYSVCNTKIKSALNINQLPTTAEEGIRKTILSFN